MDENSMMIRKWIKLGIISGLLSSVCYPLLIFVSLPQFIQVILIMAWGPLLGLSAAGGYHILALNRKTISLQIAVFSQIIAGVLVTTMLLVQFALFLSKPEIMDPSTQWTWISMNRIQLGLERERLGTLSTENISHFLHSLAVASRSALHVEVLYGDNDHHRAEAAFKALALALRQAVARTGDERVPSTKGTLR